MKNIKTLALFLASGAVLACGSSEPKQVPTVPAATEAPPVAEPAPAPVAEATTPAEPPAPTYLPGKWVWFELTTADTAKAAEFYTGLFGWQIAETEMAGQKFWGVKNGDKEIALIQGFPAATDPKAKKAKQTSSWMGYISVPDVDAAVATVTEKGGSTFMPAMDMPEVGRFAVVTDNAGAKFGVVKTNKSDEPDAQPVINSFGWVEYSAKDKKSLASATEFYSAVGGYTPAVKTYGKATYTELTASNMPRASIMVTKDKKLANTWYPVVNVANVDETVALAKKLKGKVVVKATNVENVGRYAVVQDPTGGVIGVFAMAAPAGEGKTDAAAPAGEGKTDAAAPAGEGKTDATAPAGEVKPEAEAAPAEKK